MKDLIAAKETREKKRTLKQEEIELTSLVRKFPLLKPNDARFKGV